MRFFEANSLGFFTKNLPFFALEKRKCLISSLSLSLSNIYLYTFYSRKKEFFLPSKRMHSDCFWGSAWRVLFFVCLRILIIK